MAILQSGITKSLAVSYDIDYSCRFDAVRNTHFTDTPGSDGSKRKFTISAWVKFGGTDTSVGGSGSAFRSILLRGFGADDDNNTGISAWTTFDFFSRVLNSTTNYGNIRTAAVLRDYSGWYHFVMAIDTEQGASADRCKQYINGVLQTEFSVNTIIAEDQDVPFWAITTTPRKIGIWMEGAGGTAVQSFDNAYVAEYYYIDGAQLAASVFGETNEVTNQWVPIDNSDVQAAVTFGTLGFYLDFADSSDLGKDVSGQGNHFASSGFTANDQMLDTPTNNFCTLNPLAGSSSNTYSEGNLSATGTGGSWKHSPGTIGVSSGKWYWEGYIGTDGSSYAQLQGITDSSTSTANDDYGDGYYYRSSNGYKYPLQEGPGASYGLTYTTGDIIGVALDLDSGTQTITFYKNNATQGAITITRSASWLPDMLLADPTNLVKANFGADSSFSGAKTAQGNQDANGKGDFYYTPPTDHLALCTDNLSDPEIALPGSHHSTVLYTGNGSTQSITGAGFQPDVIWIKNREITENHFIASSLQDADGNKYLYVNLETAEGDRADGVTSIDADGFSLGAWGNNNTVNDTHVSWLWKSGGVPTADNSAGAGAVPTAGSVKIDGVNLGSALAGTVAAIRISASTTAGFSIVKFPGDSSVETVAHGLSQAPEFITYKGLGDTSAWPVGSDALTNWEYYVYLNYDSAESASAAFFNDTAPSASVFTIGSTGAPAADTPYLAYCWHSVEGYSKIGNYEGNGIDDGGPFVYTGFKPAYTLIKSVDAAREFWIMDNKRDPYNDNGVQVLWPFNNDAEGDDYTNYEIDYLSNGFRIRGDNNKVNESAKTYIYMTFAESPFKYSNAR